MTTLATRSPIVRTIVSAIQKLYPPILADSTWDNTGLLLEPPPLPSAHPTHHLILLTTDLTHSVAQEAIQKSASFVVTYHPIIFRGLKSLVSTADTQQASLLLLAQRGVSVYSPHTAVDAAIGGVNDWLADGVRGGEGGGEVGVIQAVERGDVPGAGMGRIVTLEGDGITMSELVERVKAMVGMEKVMVALADRHKEMKQAKVEKVAVCAGSGGGVFKGPKMEGVEVWVTGELSHHEVLAARERGVSVVCVFHTNSERGYVRGRMVGKLQRELDAVWEGLGKEEREGKRGFLVEASEGDRDPFEIL